MKKNSTFQSPSVVPGRKGVRSIADVLIEALWLATSNGEWPELSLSDLRETASTRLGYPISASTIRSTIYGHPEVFVRSDDKKLIRYRVASELRNR